MSQDRSIHGALDEIRRLRDEIRVKIRLGEMDARDWWAGLEPKLEELESRLEEASGRASDTATMVTDELTEALRRVRDRLSERGERPSSES